MSVARSSPRAAVPAARGMLHRNKSSPRRLLCSVSSADHRRPCRTTCLAPGASSTRTDPSSSQTDPARPTHPPCRPPSHSTSSISLQRSLTWYVGTLWCVAWGRVGRGDISAARTSTVTHRPQRVECSLGRCPLRDVPCRSVASTDHAEPSRPHSLPSLCLERPC